MKHIHIIFVFLLPSFVIGQEILRGTITEVPDDGVEVGLSGANVVWLDTSVGTVTDLDGNFEIPYKQEYTQLVISYVGYATDTVTVSGPQRLTHQLKKNSDLDEVTVRSKVKASARSYIQSQNVINISSSELLKAACCNLAESFETNPSIDVNFTDAVSGTRQIKMLGLTSPYILITTENIPSIRGAAQTYGLSFIPGTWVESIQITKGAGSVVHGFESITGQINAELQKPILDNTLFVNAYAGLNGRTELNVHTNFPVSERWDTGIYAHGDLRQEKFDRNGDGFLDVPLTNQINVLNRWQYTNAEKGVVSFLNFRFLNDEKQAGQLNFDPETDRLTTNAWGAEIDTRRWDLSAKLGYVNPEIPYQTVGVQAAYSHHFQESYFGLNRYDITHNSVFVNTIYNTIIGDSRHKVKMGGSFTLDTYEELTPIGLFERKENSVGAFFEYAYDDLDALTMTAGIRVDNHNLLGLFLTPRLHVRYAPWERSALRFSVGRGKRSPNIFTENQQMFSSSRAVRILSNDGPIYGLNPEIAWNFGVSFLQGYVLFGRKGNVIFDYYRTDFQDQVVIDWENPLEVSFYNLEGSSYANNFQVELNYNIAEGFDTRLAYKLFDVRTTYRSGELEKPLIPSSRIFANMSYETQKTDKQAQWKFDATFNWLGGQRFPSTVTSPELFQLAENTPTVTTLNAQITRVFSKSFEVYVGGENITNFRQPNPVVSASDPFGANFDTTFVYGPIFGSMYYTGLRFTLN